jgi:hypothetical protein
MTDATPPGTDAGSTAPATEADSTAAATDTEATDVERRIRRALVQIRREGWKVAVIYATVDAALATLLANLVLTVFEVAALPTRTPIPGVVLDALAAVGVSRAEPTVSSAAVVGLGLGLLVFGVEVAWRVRRPLVEQFEAANPDLRESLRTARDAVRHDRRSRIVERLYADVLAGLREASSVGLVDLRRVAATLLLVSLVSVATIHLAVVDVSVAGLGEPNSTGPQTGGTDSEYAGLQDGSSILGEPEDVPEGREELDAAIDTSGSGSGEGSDAGSAAAYDSSGFDDSATVETQRAGFSERERLEDAELIREYNLRIREESDT